MKPRAPDHRSEGRQRAGRGAAGLATRRTLLGNEHVDVATSLHGLGSVLHDQGDLAGADSLYQESLAMRRELLGPDHLDVMASLLNLTSLYYQRGDFEAAEPLVRETLNTRRRILGPEHPEVAMTMGQLAVVRQRRRVPLSVRHRHLRG